MTGYLLKDSKYYQHLLYSSPFCPDLTEKPQMNPRAGTLSHHLHLSVIPCHPSFLLIPECLLSFPKQQGHPHKSKKIALHCNRSVQPVSSDISPEMLLHLLMVTPAKHHQQFSHHPHCCQVTIKQFLSLWRSLLSCCCEQPAQSPTTKLITQTALR